MWTQRCLYRAWNKHSSLHPSLCRYVCVRTVPINVEKFLQTTHNFHRVHKDSLCYPILGSRHHWFKTNCCVQMCIHNSNIAVTNGELIIGETRVVKLIVLADLYVFGEHKELCTVSCNEQFNTRTANIHCSVQQRRVDFTGVNEGQGLWQLRVMWNLTQANYTTFVVR